MAIKKRSIVFSLGGSIIFPGEEIDVSVLKQYNRLIQEIKDDFDKIYIICGGGAICRKYQKALKSVGSVSSEQLDWMGLHVTRLNGILVKLSLGDLACPELMVNPKQKINFKQKVLIGAGSRPGWSTDYVTTSLAKTYGVGEILNLSNIAYIYDKDPKKYKNAEPKERLSWEELGKMIPKKWVPGLHTPFDPSAFSLAKKMKLKVAFLQGDNIPNIRKYLKGQKFKGTLVS